MEATAVVGMVAAAVAESVAQLVVPATDREPRFERDVYGSLTGRPV